jgi:hypothetical protein
MGFKRRKSGRIVTQAKTRLSAMKEIDILENRTVDYGGQGRPLTAVDLEKQIDLCENEVMSHNQLLEQADATGNHIDAEENTLEEMYSQVLKGAVAEFGTDSDEVEMLGGTRKSERRRPRRSSPP